jgi:hypothetical protein
VVAGRVDEAVAEGGRNVLGARPSISATAAGCVASHRSRLLPRDRSQRANAFLSGKTRLSQTIAVGRFSACGVTGFAPMSCFAT